jgi:hypothetical protein
MADLPDEIRRAFRRRLSDHPASADLRARIAAAAGQTPPARSRGWLPAVAVMAGLLIVAAFTVSLLQSRLAANRQPVTSPPPTAVATGPQPAGFADTFAWDGATKQMMISTAIHDNTFFRETWALSNGAWVSVPTPSFARNLTGGVLAYDSRRRREVLAAVSYGAMETWEWDGHQWQRRATAHLPDAHSQNTSGAYSPELRATVILDGGTMPPASTWLYDGTDWRAVATLHQPDAPAHLEYDQTRHSIVALSLKDYRTWVFDGQDWTALALDSPAPTVDTGMGRQAPWIGLDQVRDRWILFGGFDGLSTFTDTWASDGSSWTELYPAMSPTSRNSVPGLADLAWDPASHHLLLFGGQASPDGAFLGDTWAWTGTTWFQVAGGAPQVSATPTPADSTAATPPAPNRTSVHYPNGAVFDSCSRTTRMDSFGNPIWYCANAPYGYRYWEPPADAHGDWTAVER